MTSGSLDTSIAECLRHQLHISQPTAAPASGGGPQTSDDTSTLKNVPRCTPQTPDGASILECVPQNARRRTPYTFANLPPFKLVSECVFRFVQGTTPWLRMHREFEIMELLRAVYPRKPGPGSSQTCATASRDMVLCELLFVAAIGAHFMNDVAAETRSVLFLSGLLHLGAGPERDLQTDNALVSTRCLTLAGFFCTFEKTISSRKYIDRAIRFAQLRGLHHSAKPPQYSDCDWASWKRVWRSLIFLDGWLSATLGSLPKVASLDDPIFAESYTAYPNDMDSCLHAEMAKVGILMGSIVGDIYAPPKVNLSHVRVYSHRLKCWHSDLPPFLKLSVALTEKHGSRQKNSILLTHCVYLGSIILLTRRILVERAKEKNWRRGNIGHGADTAAGPVAGTFMEAEVGMSDATAAEEFSDMCISAAKQLATVVGILYMERGLARQCWIAIHSAYTACLILFLNSCHQPNATLSQQDINLVYNCLNCLTLCSTRDPVASRYLEILRPIHQALLDVSAALSSPTAPVPSAPGPSIASSAPKRPRMMPLKVENTGYPPLPPQANLEMLETLILHITSIMETPFGGEGNVMAEQFGMGESAYWRYLTPMPEPLTIAVPTRTPGEKWGLSVRANGAGADTEIMDVDRGLGGGGNSGMGIAFEIERNETPSLEDRRRKLPFRNREEYEAFFRRVT